MFLLSLSLSLASHHHTLSRTLLPQISVWRERRRMAWVMQLAGTTTGRRGERQTMETWEPRVEIGPEQNILELEKGKQSTEAKRCQVVILWVHPLEQRRTKRHERPTLAHERHRNSHCPASDPCVATPSSRGSMCELKGAAQGSCSCTLFQPSSHLDMRVGRDPLRDRWFGLTIRWRGRGFAGVFCYLRQELKAGRRRRLCTPTRGAAHVC